MNPMQPHTPLTVEKFFSGEFAISKLNKVDRVQAVIWTTILGIVSLGFFWVVLAIKSRSSSPPLTPERVTHAPNEAVSSSSSASLSIPFPNPPTGHSNSNDFAPIHPNNIDATNSDDPTDTICSMPSKPKILPIPAMTANPETIEDVSNSNSATHDLSSELNNDNSNDRKLIIEVLHRLKIDLLKGGTENHTFDQLKELEQMWEDYLFNGLPLTVTIPYPDLEDGTWAGLVEDDEELAHVDSVDLQNNSTVLCSEASPAIDGDASSLTVSTSVPSLPLNELPHRLAIADLVDQIKENQAILKTEPPFDQGKRLLKSINECKKELKKLGVDAEALLSQ